MTANMTLIDESVQTFDAASVTGRTKVHVEVMPRGNVVLTVMRDGHQVERFELGYETNLGPHSILKTDGKKVEVRQRDWKSHVPSEYVEIE